jgi:hypothetical protein
MTDMSYTHQLDCLDCYYGHDVYGESAKGNSEQDMSDIPHSPHCAPATTALQHLHIPTRLLLERATPVSSLKAHLAVLPTMR